MDANHSVLLAEGVITGVNDGEGFAISGFGANVSRDVLDQSLQQAGAVYAALKQRFPDFYNELVDQFYAESRKARLKAKLSRRCVPRCLHISLVCCLRPTMPF